MNTETISTKIMQGLNSAWTEIEELRLQLALGKAEAKDLYENSKKKLNDLLKDFSYEFKAIKEDKDFLRLLNSLESLRVQLALGKAESKEIFEEQLAKIKLSLHEFELELNKNMQVDEKYAKLHLEIEKFKIKLELLQLHYKLTKVKAEYNFEDKKNALFSKLNSIKAKMLSKEKEGKQKWNHFQEEMQEAYDHLKSAFKD